MKSFRPKDGGGEPPVLGRNGEGIVSKRADPPYAPGNRGTWLKVKS